MGDITKQARLDNWAMFVMSRLQVFFNTTDYCDLTLQFEGNVQLKVHRVIMNACTEYFRLLEQECDMDGDILVMPPELQADVILPIVNFMYTGILEYQHNIFEKLYSTAELMNMPVLLKFLDAQRTKVKAPRLQATFKQEKRVVKADKFQTFEKAARKLPIWKKKTGPQINPVKPYSPEVARSVASDSPRFDNAPKPTRFEWPDDEMQDIKPFDLLPLDSSFNSISYSSKPLLTQEEELRSSSCNSTVFDDLRQLPGGKVTKKAPEPKEKDSYSLNSSVDMEDLKSYVKEQKIRSNLADYDDDEDPDDPDYVNEAVDRKRKASVSPVTVKKAKVSSEKENIVEIRASSAKVDHSKIISEVFKKYPHLVQKNKNIRLKILPKKADEKGGDKEKKAKALAKTASVSATKTTGKAQADPAEATKGRQEEQTWVCTACSANGEPVEFVLYYLYRKHMTDAHHKQFDARECKHCGEMYELPLQMTYHMYMAHAVAPPRSVSFPKCARCSFVAFDKDVMAKHSSFHALNAHHAQCNNCKLGFATGQTLKAHMQLAGHNGKNALSFDCQYCTRQLNSATSLFVHCKTTHLDDAKRDGMLSLDEQHLESLAGAEEREDAADKAPAHLPSPREADAAAANATATSTIPADLGPYDIVVLENQQQFILQGDQEAAAQQNYMTLPTLQNQSYNIAQTDIGSTDELVMVLTDHDYNDGNEDAIMNNDNSNIVVLYSHPVDGQQSQYITSQGNIMLNSETGMLEIHNDGVPISSQGESIEMIQKEIQSTMAGMTTTTTDAQKMIASAAEVGEILGDDPHEDERLQLQAVEKKLDAAEECAAATEKKVFAVEEQGTGKLINTIEEAGGDATDFAGEAVAGNVFGVDESVTHVEQAQPEPEPEPMEIDETPTTADIVETKLPVLENQCAEIEQSAEKPPEPSAPTEQEEIVSQASLVPSEDIPPCNDVPSLTSSITTEIQPLPEAEVPHELLEPTSVETPVVPEEPPHEGTLTEAETEFMACQSGQTEDEYKTSASLSVSEQCPEEPMEVDGSAQAETTESTIVDVPVVQEVVEEVEDRSACDTAEGPTESIDEQCPQEEAKSSEDVADAPTPVVEESFPDATEHAEHEHQLEDELAHEKMPSLGLPDDSLSEPVMEDNILDSSCLPPVELPTTCLDTKPEDVEAPSEEKQEENGGLDHVGADVPVETVEQEPPTLPDTAGECPEKVTEEETPKAQEVSDLSTQEEVAIDNVAIEKTNEGNDDKTQGISTLLNDWEDTDSQTSEQGNGNKAAAVNKLINDWDDE